MTSLINSRHLSFVLYDVLEAERLFALPAFAHHDRASVDAMLQTAEKLAREIFLPSYGTLDANEPHLENGRVVLPAAIGEALATFRDAGFFGMAAETEAGGLGLPRTAGNAAFLWFQAANISIANYAMLTTSAIELLTQHGSPEQKARYLAPLVEGRFLGTMALSEPHAGSSLGDMTTTARPLGDGRYAIRGTKMWISGGEHDMAENIVHMMLARIEGAANGVRGISLFAVPRKRLDANGRPSVWNNIAVAGLNHKMGQRGTVNTVLNVGEGGETIGEIIGGPGEGLARMFTMMNEARIGVSMGAVAHASAAYRHSLAYARERLQGRHPDSKIPASPQIPLVAHADIRRLLMQQKAAAEGGIAFALYLARLADQKKASETPAEREDAALLLDFLTPVFKAWMSEETLAANTNAIQILGGAGYTRDHPLEQHYRDNRLNPIHEGTNGIQAIDLLGRKVTMSGGRAYRLWRDRIDATAAAAAASLTGSRERLRELARALDDATRLLADRRAAEGPRRQLAFATDYLEACGATAFLWIWLMQANAASARLGGTHENEKAFLEGLVAACRHCADTVAPRAAAALERIHEGRAVYAGMSDAAFD